MRARRMLCGMAAVLSGFVSACSSSGAPAQSADDGGAVIDGAAFDAAAVDGGPPVDGGLPADAAPADATPEMDSATTTTPTPTDAGASTPAPMPFDFTFDTPADQSAFALATYVATPPFDTNNPENIGAPDAGVAAATVVTTGGDPGGALSISATFTDFSQNVLALHLLTATQTFIGQVLRAQVKLVSTGAYSGAVELFVLTGADYKGFGSAYVIPVASGWTDIQFIVDAPLYANSSYDPTQVVALGVQLPSDADPGDASPYGPPQPVNLLVDNIHD